MKATLIYTSLCLFVLLLGFPSRAEAYLDPGTGSMVLQIVTGGILAVMATTRLYWKRIQSFLQRDKKSDRRP
jgi:hypothetical protein